MVRYGLWSQFDGNAQLISLAFVHFFFAEISYFLEFLLMFDHLFLSIVVMIQAS